MANPKGSENGSGELCDELNKLSIASDETPPHETAPANLAEPAEGSELEKDSSAHVDDEVSTNVDDIGGPPAEDASIGPQALQNDGSDSKEVMKGDNTDEKYKFMNLPPEVRNLIYAKTLTRPDGKFFIGTKYSHIRCRSRAVLGHKLAPFTFLSEYPAEDAASTRNLAILRTSKAVYAEAGQILYGQDLIFTDLEALQNFLVGLKERQVALLQHVTIAEDIFKVHGPKRAFMPGVFVLLAPANGLKTLRIPDLNQIRAGHFKFDDEDVNETDPAASIARWDAVFARNMADEVYCRLHPYLRKAVAVRGIDTVMGVLRVFEAIFRWGPDRVRIPVRPESAEGAEWTEERKAAMRKAMGEQIVRLLEADQI